MFVDVNLLLGFVQIAPHLADHFAELPQFVLRIVDLDAVPHPPGVPHVRHKRFLGRLGRLGTTRRVRLQTLNR